MLTGSRAPTSPGVQYFGDSRCRSIWQWQIVIAFTVVAIAVGAALLTPMRFTDGNFGAGLILIITVTIGSLAVPWHRLGSGPVLILPIVDAVAITLIALGGTAAATVLWVFPVAWVATYYSSGLLIAMLSVIAAMRLTNLLMVGVTPETTISACILLTTLTFVGIIMSVGAQRNRSSRRLLKRQSERLAHALQRVNDQRARTNRLMNSLDVGIARVGAGGLIEVSNERFRALFSLGPAAEQHPIRPAEYRTRRGEVIPPEQTTIARASRGERFSDEIVWLFGLDGVWRAIKTSTKAIENGIVTGDGLMLIVEDVTESSDPHAGENARRRTISHELRNPLTAILGHIDLLLEREDLAEAAREQLSVVERAGERMQRLIDDALATPQTRRDDVGVDFDLSDIARASLEGFMPAAESAGVMVESVLDEKLQLCGDAFRIRQVVDNLIGNAIKYAQRGGHVSVHALRPASGEVALIISDTGIGISQEDLPRIFDREFRTALARERGIPGTGLGLSISREIVNAEGGRLEVHSELEQGTQVTIVLPVPSPEGNPE